MIDVDRRVTVTSIRVGRESPSSVISHTSAMGTHTQCRFLATRSRPLSIQTYSRKTDFILNFQFRHVRVPKILPLFFSHFALSSQKKTYEFFVRNRKFTYHTFILPQYHTVLVHMQFEEIIIDILDVQKHKRNNKILFLKRFIN
jgi:hypothetical protein